MSDLTDLYDGKTIAKRTVEKSIAVSDYSLTILASSTKEWIKELGSDHHIAGGFVNRHLNCVGSPERIISLSREVSQIELTPVIETLKKLVPDGVHAVQEGLSVRWEGPKAQEISLTATAALLWERYYVSEKKAQRRVRSDRLIEISAREQLHALKQAAIRALLDGRGEIDALDLIYGARLARWSTRNAIELLGIQELFDFGIYNKPAKKILRYLQEEEPQSKNEIAERHGGKQDHVNAAISLLVREKFVKETNGRYFLGERFQAQDSDIEEYFGKSSICDHVENLSLEASHAG